MRTKQDHVKHCEYITRPGTSNSERLHFSKVYSVNRASILMELADFDITRQLPRDLMHVLLEGVFPYHMKQLLRYVIDSNLLILRL